MIGTVVKAGDDAFVVLGLRLEAGPVSDGQRLYYSAKPKAGEGDASHVAVGPHDVFYSDGPCIYRAPQ
jgi:hypothetical protein